MAALYIWPTLTPQQTTSGQMALERAREVIRERLDIHLALLPPTEGIVVQVEPSKLGLIECEPGGAYAHATADLAVVFKPLQHITDCAGRRHGRRYANVDIDFILSTAQADSEERLYNVMLHALLNALAREPTKLWNTWGGQFLVPHPNCDLEYRYPSAYGKSLEERARAVDDGWKHYNEAILRGTVVPYVPYLDDPEDAAHPWAKPYR